MKDVSSFSGDNLLYDRNIITLSDGGTMSIDWYWPDELDPNNGKSIKPTSGKYKVLVIFSGIGGHSQKFYIRLLASFFVNRGSFSGEKYVVGILQNRGSGGNPLLTPQVHEFTRSADAKQALEFIH